MFYHPQTLIEILSIRKYLINKEKDFIDEWIQMVLTNRLTGHSKGFLSVYTLPPNQATSPKRQIEINKKYKNTISILLEKSKRLIKNLSISDYANINGVNSKSLFTSEDAGFNKHIQDNSVDLTVTSPPFLDIVKYDADNWLRCYVNNIGLREINISMLKSEELWNEKMRQTLSDLHRVSKPNGYAVFDVGEVRCGKIRLEENIMKIASSVGFHIEALMINENTFTKTSNIWGVKNNEYGTNTNRLVVLRK
jgi:hypothetical protein